MPRRKRGNKYGAVKTQFGGVTYDSKAEAMYARQLAMLKAAGSGVRDWTPHPVVDMAGARYTADFLVEYKDGTIEYVDVKGVETPRFRTIKKQWPNIGPPHPLVVVKRKGSRFERAQVVEGRKEQ